MEPRFRLRKPSTQILALALTLLASASLGKADIQTRTNFTITYGGWGDTPNVPVVFTVTQVSPTPLSLAGFTNGQPLPLGDPLMDINLGGDPMSFPPPGNTITIPPDVQSYVNDVGFDIEGLEFTTPFLSRYFGEVFSCDGRALPDCGYKVTTDGQGNQILDIRFSDVPEPASWLLLLTVAGGVTLKRLAFSSKRP